jgi:hypothetical protein
MAGYEFGFLVKQSLGHVTHTNDLVANVAFFKTHNSRQMLPDTRPRRGPGRLLAPSSQKQALRLRVKDFEVT